MDLRQRGDLRVFLARSVWKSSGFIICAHKGSQELQREATVFGHEVTVFGLPQLGDRANTCRQASEPERMRALMMYVVMRKS